MSRTDKLFQLAAAHKDLANQIADLKAKQTKVGDKIVAQMQSDEIKTIKGDEYQITLVAPERVSYNEARAQKVLGPKVWKKATKRVLDKDQLHYLVQTGTVSVEQLERFSKVTATNPYPRISIVDNSEE